MTTCLKSAIMASLACMISPLNAWSQQDRAKEAADLILKLCIADSTQVEITQNKNTVEVTKGNEAVTIKKNESVGIVGGISSSLTQLSAQQASETRACTQRYLKKIVDAMLNPDNQAKRAPEESSPEFGGIHIISMPGSPQCTVNFTIFLGDTVITPTAVDWLVNGIKLGMAKWVIRGNVNCDNGRAYCSSNNENQSGQLNLQSGRSYFFHWDIPLGSFQGSECHFVLNQ